MKKPRAYVFIDASNFHYFLKKDKWKIDWIKFKAYCEGLFENPCFFYYEGVPSKGHYFDICPNGTINDFSQTKKKKLEFFKFLKKKGFRVRHKPVGRVYDNTSGQYKHKCNFDVELTIDAIDNMENYDCFLLASGDGDFQKLVKYLKGKRKKTVIIAAEQRLSYKLEKAANSVIYLNDLKNDIKL